MSIIESFLVFGGTFLTRPVGGVLMGWVGDRISRKRALELSIFLMAVPTFTMGCLPTFKRVRWWAVVLLVVVQLMQGLSAGGQLMSSLVFVAEGHDSKHWGWYWSVSERMWFCNGLVVPTIDACVAYLCLSFYRGLTDLWQCLNARCAGSLQ